MLQSLSTSQGSPLLITSGAFLAGTFYEELQQVLFDLRWLVAFIVILVFTDFWTGLTASVRVRKENFRISRALRRTIVKFLEYINFIIFGLLLSKAILEPFGIGTDVTGGAVGACCALLIEFDSIYGHVCDLHGIHNRFSFKRLFIAYIKKKDEDIGNAIEDTLNEKK